MKATTAVMLTLAAVGAACTDYNTTGPGKPTYSAPGASDGSAGASSASRQGFGFNGTVSGFPTGTVFLTGGGSFEATTATNVVPSDTTVASGGGFRCVGAVAQGPLAGCGSGEGVRWDTAQLLASTTFKCTGADAGKHAATGPGTVVLLADFYRAGDGIDESFTAQMIVSDGDLAPDIPGEQTLWVQGVGCGDAIAHFNR